MIRQPETVGAEDNACGRGPLAIIRWQHKIGLKVCRSPMLLYRLTFNPNGYLDAQRLETDDIAREAILPFEQLFDGGPNFNSAMPHAPEVAVKWTGSADGQALLTCFYQGQLFLS